MKTYAYTYRDKAGALKKSALQAADRLDALRQIRAMGCVPVSVTEGVFKTGSGLPPFLSPSRLALLGGVVFLALIVGTVLRFTAKKPVLVKNAPPSEKITPTAVVKKPVQPKLTELKQPLTNLPDKAQTIVKAADEKRIKREERFGALTPENVQPPFEKEPEKEDLRPFKTASEQLLSMVLSGQPGDSVAPLPVSDDDDLEEDALKALNSTIYVRDDDSEDTLAHKANVAAAKEQLRELKAKEGWTMVEYVRAVEAQRKEDAQLKKELYQELEKRVNDSTIPDDKIRSDLTEINAILSERGIPPIQEEDLGFHEQE